MKLGFGTICTVIGVAFAATSALSAQTVTYTGSGTNPGTGSGLAAQVTLTLNAGVLGIDLINTGAPGKADSDALCALLFTLAPGNTLTPLTASLLPGSVYTNPPAFSIGQEWGYNAGFSGPAGTNAGVSAAGLGLFGSGNFAANGQHLQGLDYGLINGIAANANGPMQAAVLVNNGVHLDLAAPTLKLSDISNVRFQYGTALTDSNLPGTPPVPEPGTLSLLATAVLSAVPFLRKRVR
ncbi:MAG TPA: XDD4 family exosortase-dependent surface protein [Armatimonadota bacterium]|jgi:hypothetical protein